MAVKIREWRRSDIDFLFDLNESCVPAVNKLSKDELIELVSMASFVRIAETKMTMLGAVVGFQPGTDYQSENYQWFCERYDQFLYIDRIMVAKRGRNQNVGSTIYEHAIKWADAKADGRMTCEVNIAPPNPTSLSFHDRFNFKKIGEGVFEPGVKEVAYFVRSETDDIPEQKD